MKQILILITLMMCLGKPAFSQGNNGVGGVGRPTLDGIPNDAPLIPSGEAAPPKDKTPTPPPRVKKPSDRAHELKKNVAFMQLNHYLKKLIKEANSNVVNFCNADEPKITGPKSLVEFLEKKELAEVLKLNAINDKKDCKATAFACVFNGGTFVTFSKLIHDPYFVEFLVDTRHWKQADAAAVAAYFMKIEMALKK